MYEGSLKTSNLSYLRLCAKYKSFDDGKKKKKKNDIVPLKLTVVVDDIDESLV